jgi:hypothetical protein
MDGRTLKINRMQTFFLMGEKPGLVVRAENSRPRGHGFKSRCILYSYSIKEKLKIMVAIWGTPKKYY